VGITAPDTEGAGRAPKKFLLDAKVFHFSEHAAAELGAVFVDANRTPFVICE
jgi:hypothetical protein